jgi:hypothetical protein
MNVSALLVGGQLPYGESVPAAYDYSDLHQLIDRLEPEQADELREHALRLVISTGGRFRVLQSFGGPDTDMGARAREILRADAGHDAGR